MSTRATTGTFWSPLGLALALLGLAACSGPDRLGPIQVAFGAGGELHLAVRVEGGQDEGGGWSYGAFRYGVADGSGWHVDSVPLEDRSAGDSFGRPYRLALDGAGRAWIVVDTLAGVQAYRRREGVWRSAGPWGDPLPDEASQAWRAQRALVAAWGGADGVVRVLAGRWLFDLGGDEALPSLAGARDTGAACPPGEGSLGECHFAPTGPAEGQAAVPGWQGPEGATDLRTLRCDADACVWRDEPGVNLGTRDPGGSTNPARRVFFHRADGTPLLVRPVQPASGPTYALLASSPAGEVVLLENDVFVAGAAPRPAGGFVALALTYGGALRLVVVEPDAALRIVEVGTHGSGDGVDPLALVVRLDSGVEVLHAFLGQGADAIRHLRVDLASDAISEETLSF